MTIYLSRFAEVVVIFVAGDHNIFEIVIARYDFAAGTAEREREGEQCSNVTAKQNKESQIE